VTAELLDTLSFADMVKHHVDGRRLERSGETDMSIASSAANVNGTVPISRAGTDAQRMRRSSG